MAESTNCQICNSDKSKYSCPRCNILYCSVSCYQSESHLQCSEAFYYKCVQEELKNKCCDSEEKKKMLETLKRLNQESDSECSLDSDDEEDTLDLENRMVNVNLDDEEAVWKKLTPEERHKFRKLISSGSILKLLPEWEPWWKTRKRKTLIQECGENFDWKSLCPKVLSNIPELTNLTKTKPSPKVPFILLNILMSYVFTMRWFRGTASEMSIEAISTCIALSAALRSKKVFENSGDALVAFENDLSECTWVDEDDYDRNILLEDLEDIVRISGADDLYYCVKAALSDLISLCASAMKVFKNCKTENLRRFSDPPPKVALIQQISKRMSYYLAWTEMNGSLLVNLLSVMNV